MLRLHTIGLQDVAQELQEPVHRSGDTPQAIFDAQQAVLSNIMLVSALLLGFIVTGTMLSVSLTGNENFGIIELMVFFKWSGLAAMSAFMSLVISFLTAVWGASVMTAGGPTEAAKAMTSGSTLRHIAAEGSLYMSLFFFLVSLNTYIQMVDSGPDICASRRGSSAFCARGGEDLYRAADAVCKNCTAYNGTGDYCHGSTDPRSCLCEELCRFGWERRYTWETSSLERPPGVEVSYFHWFGYWTPGSPNKPRREKVITAASALMCNHDELEAIKDECFKHHGRGCSLEYLAWDKAEECMEGAIQDMEKCAKVCSWSDGYPPKEYLKRMTLFAFVPLGIMLLVLTFGRTILIAVRAYKVCQEHHTEIARHLSGGEGSSEDSAANQATLPEVCQEHHTEIARHLSGGEGSSEESSLSTERTELDGRKTSRDKRELSLGRRRPFIDQRAV